VSRGFAPVLKANGGGALVNMLSALSWFSNRNMAGGREAMQQQKLRRAFLADLAVEDGAAVDFGGPIGNRGHKASPFA
jgi:hypothetical protein